MRIFRYYILSFIVLFFIPGCYTMVGSVNESEDSYTNNTTKEYFDEDVQNGRRYFYKLEEVETDGDTKEHAPAKAVPRLIYGNK